MNGRESKLAPIPFKPCGVLFDMDGLLFDSETMYRDAFFELLADRNLKVAEPRFVELVGLGWGETVTTLGQWLPGVNAENFVDDWKRACHPQTGRFPALKPGVPELLDLLDSARIPAAIATGAQRAVAEAYLDHHGLAGMFAALTASEDVVRGKPHPDPFGVASASLGKEPATCLALEDSKNGIRSARAAGCHAIFVPDLIPADDEVAAIAHGIASDLHEVRAALTTIM